MRARNTVRGEGDGTMMSGGQALKRAIHVARARTDMTSDMELSRRAGVSYDTLMNWYGDKTTPRGHELKKVADALGIRYASLMDAWEGRPAEPPPLHESIRELIAEMRLSRAQQDEATVAILRALGAVVPRGPDPRGRHDDTARATRSGRDRA